MNATELWKRYQRHLCRVRSVGLTLDVSRMNFDDGFLAKMAPAIGRAYEAMDALEKGAIANPDEKRMVGHYWLRAPELAPTPEITQEIRDTLAAIKAFAAGSTPATIKPPTAAKFTRVLSIGIGGSALGPEFVADALGEPGRDKMAVHFLDNTDPDGIARVLARLGGQARRDALRRDQQERRHARDRATACSPPPPPTRPPGSTSPSTPSPSPAPARSWTSTADQRRLARPLPDVGLGRRPDQRTLRRRPAARGASRASTSTPCSPAPPPATTRPASTTTATNPAALLALMWYHATGGKGLKDMVVLPYKDRLLLFSRYLQQLVMESLGKRLDLDGKRVDQGISVYGNKGSTDQHAYVQQLRDGVNNFFLTFIRVLEDGGTPVEVEPGVTPGRLPPRLPARHPRGALRQRPPVGHDHRPPGRRPDRRRADRAVRAGRRLLRAPS